MNFYLKSFVSLCLAFCLAGCAPKVKVTQEINPKVLDSILSMNYSNSSDHFVILVENLEHRDLFIFPAHQSCQMFYTYSNEYGDCVPTDPIIQLKSGQRAFVEISRENNEIYFVDTQRINKKIVFDFSNKKPSSEVILVECNLWYGPNQTCNQKIIDLETIKSSYLDLQFLREPVTIDGEYYKNFVKANERDDEASWNRYLSSSPPAFYRSLANEKLELVIVRKLEKLRSEQLCKVNNNDFIYTGKSCQDGLAHGVGTAVGAPGNGKRALDGEFVRGVFVKGKLADRKGIKWYDGQVDSVLSPHGFGTLFSNSGEQIFKGNFVQGKAEGSGLCEYQRNTEPCSFTAGRRTDQVHLMRVEVARMEKAAAEARAERERADQARQEAQARQQQAARERAESSNEDRNVIGALFGVATGVAMKNVGGASSGDSLQAGMAMFNDVSNNTTSNMQNLNQSKSNSSSQLGGIYQSQNGLSQQGSGNALVPQGCGIELARCGMDRSCNDRVSQSSICNNGSSSYTYDDMLNSVKKDPRIKANPNIR